MKKNKIISLIIVILIFILNWYANSDSDTDLIVPDDGSSLTVRYIDVGQGDCQLITFPNGKNMLIDAGTTDAEKTLPLYLQSLGIGKIDYVIGTHPHEDHIGGLDAVINSFDIGEVYMPKATTTTKTYKDVLLAVKNKGLSINSALGGKTIIDSNSLKAEILAPNSEKYDSLNNYSIVLKIQYGDTSFMFTGDAEKLSEKEILNKFGTNKLKSDVLKMGHHGSSTSSSNEFFNAVAPNFAVISCGKDNEYGHPHKEIQNLLEKNNVTTYRTDINGTITAISDGKNIKFKTEK